MERSKIPKLAGDEMIEPIGPINTNYSSSSEGKIATTDNGIRRFQGTKVKDTDNFAGSEESTVSILKTLANSNPATKSSEDLECGSVSSTDTDLESEIKERQQRQRSQLGAISNASGVVSVQDFFFNNPNSSRLSLSSASLNDSQLCSSTDYLGSIQCSRAILYKRAIIFAGQLIHK